MQDVCHRALPDPIARMEATALDMLLRELGLAQGVVRTEEDQLFMVMDGAVIPLNPLRRRVTSLSRGQRALVKHILLHRDESAFLSAAELGRQAGVSESTVVRFASSIGLPGFPALQQLLRYQVRQKLSISARVEGLASLAVQGPGVAEIVCRADLENVAGTYEGLSGDDFERSLDILSSASQVYAIGLRTSAALATFFCVAMRYIGRTVEYIDLGVGDHWERFTFITPRDAVLGISFRNYNRLTLEMLEYAYTIGAPSVVITDSAMAPVCEHASVALVVKRNLTSIVESSTAPLSLLNALVLGVALKDETQSIQALRAREAMWQERHIYASPHGWREWEVTG